MYLFFDTETNGLPKNYKAPHFDVHNWPRIIQLAYILVDENFNEVERFSSLIKPDGWTIPISQFWIENGYTTQRNMDEGIPMTTALAKLLENMGKAKYIIAHNMSFDFPIINCELIRYSMAPSSTPPRICTMMTTTNFVGIPGKFGFKWPKLDELHFKLFGTGFEDAHDALADVTATVRCFQKLVEIGVIKPQQHSIQ